MSFGLFESRQFLERLTFVTRTVHSGVRLFTHLDKLSVAVTVRHEGELAEEGQAVFARLVQFQLVRLADIAVVRPVAHWNAGKCSSKSSYFKL
jgi:hypothetical protein